MLLLGINIHQDGPFELLFIAMQHAEWFQNSLDKRLDSIIEKFHFIYFLFLL